MQRLGRSDRRGGRNLWGEETCGQHGGRHEGGMARQGSQNIARQWSPPYVSTFAVDLMPKVSAKVPMRYAASSSDTKPPSSEPEGKHAKRNRTKKRNAKMLFLNVCDEVSQ